jgi:hypothetical protein
MRAEVVGDTTQWSFEPVGFFIPFIPIIGGDVERGRLPLYDSVRARFEAAAPGPKLVRVDSPESHASFRETRRAPYYRELEARLSALEAALRTHAADDHAGGRLARLEEAFEEHLDSHPVDVLGAEADKALSMAARGGQPIPLPLPDWARGKIECWRDGPEVLCSVRFATPRGEKRVATSGAPLARSVDKVIGWADREGVESEVLVHVVGALAQVSCGWDLAKEICGVVDGLCEIADEGVFSVRSAADPRAAAAMAMLQRCQRGDRRACAEMGELRRAQPELFEFAKERLLRGQKEKARSLR